MPLHQTVEFVLRPLFAKKIWAQNNDTVTRLGKSFVDLAPKTVSYAKNPAIVPYFQPSALKFLSKRLDYGGLILTRVTDESIPIFGPGRMTTSLVGCWLPAPSR